MVEASYKYIKKNLNTFLHINMTLILSAVIYIQIALRINLFVIRMNKQSN